MDEEDELKYREHVYIEVRNGYLGVRLRNSKKLLARVILNCPTGLVVDHRNRNSLDCRKSNLRICTLKQNAANTSAHKDSKYSKYKGVSKDIGTRGTKNWQAQILFNGKKLRKRFYTELEAALQYNQWASELHGDFAVLNEVLQKDTK